MESKNDPTPQIPLNISPAKVDAIHRALLSGLLSNIATRASDPTGGEYIAARGARAAIFPGSALFKRRPGWIMAAELVETTKLYARTIAPIQPQWAERLAEHLVKRTYSEPHWQPQTAHVSAYERVTLHGLTLIARRSVHYGPIDPEASRQLFIYHALVLGDYRTSASFFAHNRQLIERIASLEARQRRRDLLADDQTIYDFFDRRIPAGIFNGPLFEKWRAHIERGRPTLLFLQEKDVLRRPIDVRPEDYPDAIDIGGMSVPLRYVFDPSSESDGISAAIPLAALNQLPAEPFEWLVPGMLREKVIALMKTMPKALRVKFVPVPEHADQALAEMRTDAPSLHDELARALGRMLGEPVNREAFVPEQLAPYLRMNFRIVDDAGEIILAGRDLDELRRRLGMEARRAFAQQPPGEFHRDHITRWDFGDLPERIEVRRNAMTLPGYPALVDKGDSVSIRTFDSHDAAARANRAGVKRLLMLQLRKEVMDLIHRIGDIDPMRLNYATIGPAGELEADLVDAILDRALFGADDAEPPIRTRRQFLDRAQIAWRNMGAATGEIASLVGVILEKHQALRLELSKVAAPALVASYQDMRRQLTELIRPGFIRSTPLPWLAHFPRYLGAIEMRLQKLHSAGLNRDLAAMEMIDPLQRRYRERIAPPGQSPGGSELERYRWMLEELRVSLFAQELRTSMPVSAERLESQWSRINRK